MNQYPYSKYEGGIILAIILMIWGLGAGFEEFNIAAKILLVSGFALFSVLYYLRFVKK